MIIYKLFIVLRKTMNEFDEVIDRIIYILKPENGELLIKTRNNIVELYKIIYKYDYKYCDKNILTDEFSEYNKFFLNPKEFKFT